MGGRVENLERLVEYEDQNCGRTRERRSRTKKGRGNGIVPSKEDPAVILHEK